MKGTEQIQNKGGKVDVRYPLSYISLGISKTKVIEDFISIRKTSWNFSNGTEF